MIPTRSLDFNSGLQQFLVQLGFYEVDQIVERSRGDIRDDAQFIGRDAAADLGCQFAFTFTQSAGA